MAYKFYVTIEGSQQGEISDEGTSKLQRGKLTGDGYQHEIRAPLDTVSGMITGKIQHQPITFRHFWGSSSPLLFRAMTTNEMLKRVMFEFVRPSERAGAEEVFYKVTLTNAHITSIQYRSDQVTGVGSDPSELASELISMGYQTIQVEYVPGGIVASVEWSAERS